MADNPFDQFDTPKPTAQSGANPFDAFDAPTSSTTESSKNPIDIALNKSALIPFVAGGVTELEKGLASGVELVAPETGKTLYDIFNKAQQRIQKANPVATTAGKYGSYTLPFAGLTKVFQGGRTALGLGEASTLGKVGESAVKSGTIGGVTTPTEEGRVKSAATGAVLGPAAEVGIPAAGKLLSKIAPNAVEKAQKLLSKISPKTDVDTLGKEMESTLNQNVKNVMSARSKEYTELMAKAKQELAGNENRVVDNYTRFIKEQLINKAQDINNPQQKLLLESYNNIKNKSLDGIELEIRRLKDIGKETSISPGYNGARSAKAREAAQQLENAVDSITKTAKKARENYRDSSEPINVYDYIVGKKVLQGEADPAKLPNMLFNSRFSVQKLKELVPDQQLVEKYAKNHIANELDGLSAKEARSWYKTNESWLDELGGETKKLTRDYVDNLAQTQGAVNTRNRVLIGLGVAGTTITGASELKKALGL
jgi:hypothetical protein